MTMICINAVSVREGGSLVVLGELLQGMQRLRPGWQWTVVTNERARVALPELARVTLHVLAERELSGWRLLRWYGLGLPRLLRHSGADLLFSQTNYLPWWRVSCPALLLEQHAGHFSPLFARLLLAQAGLLTRLAWFCKGRWVRRSLAVATRITVQSHALRTAIIEDTGIAASSIEVIAHGCGLKPRDEHAALPPRAGEPARIGYITKYGIQKNFGVLLAAMADLRKRGFELRLVLTLDTSEPQVKTLLAQADELGITDLVENHGDLPPSDIVALYQSLHLFVFPSLCESFGFPLLEAMATGLPLVVTATPSNLEVAGSGVLAFAADDHLQLASHLHGLLTDPAGFREQARRSLTRSAVFCWEQAALATVDLIERLLPVREEA